jgi:serine/threonine-protein kinase
MHEFEIVAENGDVSAIEILHRDVCPSNIFVSMEGDVLLGDLGCALSPWIPQEHMAPQAGHVAYKAPERLTGTGQASVHSDLFGLAVVLWEMLRGERCFAARSELEVMDAIVRFDIAHASRRVSGLSAKLAEIVRRNLDRDPARRYESAYQVLQRLSQSPEAIHAERARSELGALVREARGLSMG